MEKYWFICLLGFLLSCNSKNNSASEDTDTTIIDTTGTAIAIEEVSSIESEIKAIAEQIKVAIDSGDVQTSEILVQKLKEYGESLQDDELQEFRQAIINLGDKYGTRVSCLVEEYKDQLKKTFSRTKNSLSGELQNLEEQIQNEVQSLESKETNQNQTTENQETDLND